VGKRRILAAFPSNLVERRGSWKTTRKLKKWEKKMKKGLEERKKNLEHSLSSFPST